MLYPLSYEGGGWGKDGEKTLGRVVIRLRGVKERARSALRAPECPRRARIMRA